MSELRPINTAAKPTNECSAATSCGIPVISTRLATTTPMTAPITIAPINIELRVTLGSATVATTAIAIPTIPNHTARFAFS